MHADIDVIGLAAPLLAEAARTGRADGAALPSRSAGLGGP
jgi:hypothetical protein